MKLFGTIFCAVLCALTSAASAADLVVEYIKTHGEADFAPSTARTLYLHTEQANFTITHAEGALTVSAQIPFCVQYDAPLEVSVTDTDGDRSIDYHYYSLEEWSCEGNKTSSFPDEYLQKVFDLGITEVMAAIVEEAQ